MSDFGTDEQIQHCHLRCKIIFAFKVLPPGEPPSSSSIKVLWSTAGNSCAVSEAELVSSHTEPGGIKAQGWEETWEIASGQDGLCDIHTIPGGCFPNLVSKFSHYPYNQEDLKLNISGNKCS